MEILSNIIMLSTIILWQVVQLKNTEVVKLLAQGHKTRKW